MNNYSDTFNQILTYSREEAFRLNNDNINPEHLLLGILRDGNNRAVDALRNIFFVNVAELKKRLEDHIRDTSAQLLSNNITFSSKATSVLRLSILEARQTKSKLSEPEHLLLAIARHKDNYAAQLLQENSIGYQELYKEFVQPVRITPKASDIDFDDEEENAPSDNKSASSSASTNTGSRQTSNTDHPAIDNFGFDLTKAAAEGKLDPVVGREMEIERLAQILSRRKKNNPVLIGEPGVGKSAIVEGLALRICQHKVSRVLWNKKIVALDMTTVVAGTKYRGQFEERMKSIINELKQNPDIIVFIDEIHTIVGAGNQAGQMDAANMMKPSLARGELQCIGATTLDEYRKNIEKDGALERRFQKILVEPTTTEETLTILHNIKDRYEEHHNVTYTEKALETCVKLTERYVTDRSFPDKAIDVLDEVGSRVHIKNVRITPEIEQQENTVEELQHQQTEALQSGNYELAAQTREKVRDEKAKLDEMRAEFEKSLDNDRVEVTEENVAETVSMMTGIPVQRMNSSDGIRLKGMRQELKNSVIAQDNAIDKVVSAIQRSRIGIKDPARPIGVFMFLGPTGVGKTYLAKKLAENIFGTADALVRIDMSEYMEKFTVSRLVGAPPGYVGYEEGGMLTEKVRRKPYSIVLLDEIEKAHADVFNILLQVMDDGRLTDSNGRTVDFRNTIVIMTSNVGTRQLKDYGRGAGFSAMAGMNDQEVSRAVIQKAISKQFSPEFLNRIDEIITFEQLELDSIVKIIDVELQGITDRVNQLGYHLDITEDAKRWIAEKGYDKQFGARPLRRAIQQHLEDAICELIVEEKLSADDTIKAMVENEKLEVKIINKNI